MKSSRIRKSLIRLGTGLSVVVASYVLIAASSWQLSEPDVVHEVAGVGTADQLNETYQRWSTSYASNNPKGPVLTMLWTKGLSNEFSKAKGIAQLDL